MVRKVHKYADGGKVVVRPDRPPVRGSSSGKSTADSIRSTVGSVAKSTSVGDTLANKRKRQMEDLGLRNGGKVKRKC